MHIFHSEVLFGNFEAFSIYQNTPETSVGNVHREERFPFDPNFKIFPSFKALLLEPTPSAEFSGYRGGQTLSLGEGVGVGAVLFCLLFGLLPSVIFSLFLHKIKGLLRFAFELFIGQGRT